MILDRILEHKKAELRHKQSRGYMADLTGRIKDLSRSMGFAVALDATKTANSPALIAEIKKASPSVGFLRPEYEERFDHLEIAKSYYTHGASALSVLTDQDFFQGSLEHLREIKHAIPLPVLNKEFMIGEVQFYEARAYGADAVLLIVAALERELDTVLERIPDARLIGINNRDLKTFATDLGVTLRLAKRIPRDRLIVSESGIHKRDDVIKLLEAGVHAMLVGESLIRADNIGAKIRELRGTDNQTPAMS